MKYRIQKFTSRQKDKVYEYTWLGYSYRNEKGKPTFKCVANLSGLPAEVIVSMSATPESDSPYLFPLYPRMLQVRQAQESPLLASVHQRSPAVP